MTFIKDIIDGLEAMVWLVKNSKSINAEWADGMLEMTLEYGF